MSRPRPLLVLASGQQHGVRLRGVVVNQVVPAKRDMILEYYTKALKMWGVPLLGCIPFKHELRAPSIADLTKLLKGQLISAAHCKLRHFSSIRMAVGFYDEVWAAGSVVGQRVVEVFVCCGVPWYLWCLGSFW